MDDFASGTSSRSTKLIHGGVRYLQKAIFGLDIEQYRLVREALTERANLLEIAPHLSRPLPIMLPVYRLAGCGRGFTLLSYFRILPPFVFFMSFLFPLLSFPLLSSPLSLLDGGKSHISGWVSRCTIWFLARSLSNPVSLCPSVKHWRSSLC